MRRDQYTVQKFVLDLLQLFCCLLRQCPESTPCPIIK